MGMFDILEAHCPSCGDKLDVQTKLGDCLLLTIRPGDECAISNIEFASDRDRCDCGKIPIVVIKNHKFMGFLNE